jgi:predicted ATP-dependent serine protease
MAKRLIFNIKTIKEKKFHKLELSPEYTELMGLPERKFTGIFYGESGSGKSVKALQFADYFAKNFGKVLYNSHEEKVNQTIQNRINNFNIDAQRLWIANGVDFEDMCDFIQRNYYRLVIIDSVKYMNFTIDQLKELRERFSKRQLSIIMIDFGEAKGKPASGKDLIHASDVKMYFKNGRVHSTSRYLNQPTEKQLFMPKTSKKQPSLFDY